MKFEVPIKVDIDDVTKLIHDLQCLQTYKLGVNDTMVLVSLDNVADVFADHIRAKRLDKDTNVPTKSALDHIHNVVAENAFNKGYDAGHAEGYERGKKDTATLLAIRITTKYDEVLGVGDALEEIDNLLEEVAKGE